jgi:predicted transcriptional regulator
MPTPAANERVRRRLLSQESRRRVYEAICADPGIHLRELSRLVAQSLGNVEHHLQHLVRHGLVSSHRGRNRCSYFPTGQVDARDARLLHLLRKEPCRTILTALADAPDQSTSEVAARLGLSSSTASYHLKRLKEEGLIESVSVGRERLHHLREAEHILDVARRYLDDAGVAASTGVLDSLVERTRAVRPATASRTEAPTTWPVLKRRADP